MAQNQQLQAVDPFAKGPGESYKPPVNPFERDANEAPQFTIGEPPAVVEARHRDVAVAATILVLLAVIAFLVLRAIVRALRKVPDDALERTAHAAGRVAQRVDDVSGRAKSAFRQGRGTE